MHRQQAPHLQGRTCRWRSASSHWRTCRSHCRSAPEHRRCRRRTRRSCPPWVSSLVPGGTRAPWRGERGAGGVNGWMVACGVRATEGHWQAYGSGHPGSACLACAAPDIRLDVVRPLSVPCLGPPGAQALTLARARRLVALRAVVARCQAGAVPRVGGGGHAEAECGFA
jgi:hypothetical protein